MTFVSAPRGEVPQQPPWWRDRATWIVGSGAALPLLAQVLLPPIACPFKTLTGWDCPLCGGTRAVTALAHGSVGTAADENLLVLAAVLVAVPLVLLLVLFPAADRAARRTPVLARPGAWPLVILVAWTVMRNLDHTGWMLAGGGSVR